MGVRKRENKWWVDFSFNRARYRRPSPENSRAGAQAYEALLKQRLARGEPVYGVEASKTAFKDFAAEWFQTYVKNNNKPSEVASKETILRVHLLPFFGRMNLEKINNFEVEKYKAKKIAAGLNLKTVNNHLAVLRMSLRCALEWELIKLAPVIKRLTLPPQKYDYLTVEECGDLINAAEGIWQDMIVTALGTGLRFGELIALTWDDVNMQLKELTVRQAFSRGVLGSPKNNRTRRMPMTDSVYETLKHLQKNESYVFTSDGRPLRQVACIKKLQRICKKAGLRKIGWHCLRHTFASHMAQAGANLVAVQNLLGHSDIRTTMRYAHINGDTLREAIHVLNRERTPKKICHDSVTGPQFEVNMSDISNGKDTDIFAQQKEKRAEALLSKT